MMNFFTAFGQQPTESRQVIAGSRRQSEHLISAGVVQTGAGRSSSRSTRAIWRKSLHANRAASTGQLIRTLAAALIAISRIALSPCTRASSRHSLLTRQSSPAAFCQVTELDRYSKRCFCVFCGIVTVADKDLGG
jgi:hypothetical protein